MPFPTSMMVSKRAKACDLPLPLRRIGQQRQQGVSEPRRRAITLEKFRHDIFAEHQIGKDDRRNIEKQTCRRIPRSVTLCRRRPSARRQVRVRGSMCLTCSAPLELIGKPQPFLPPRLRREPARATMQLLSAQYPQAGTPPGRSLRPDRTVRSRAQLPPRTRAPSAGSRLSRLPGKTKISGGFASRSAFFEIFRPQVIDTFNQRMTHIGAGRPTKFGQDFRLKRQQREDMIDIGPHCSRTARTPRPYRGADVVDNRDFRQPRPHALCHPVREFRAVDDDKRIGLCRYNGIGRFANASQDLWQAPRNCRETDNRKISEWKQTRHSFRGHVGAADARKMDAALRCVA